MLNLQIVELIFIYAAKNVAHAVMNFFFLVFKVAHIYPWVITEVSFEWLQNYSFVWCNDNEWIQLFHLQTSCSLKTNMQKNCWFWWKKEQFVENKSLRWSLWRRQLGTVSHDVPEHKAAIEIICFVLFNCLRNMEY